MKRPHIPRLTVGRWWYLFVLWPLPLALLIAGLQHELYESHCGALHTMSVLFGSVKHPRHCSRLTLSADLPSIVLAISVTLAAWFFHASEKSWTGLLDALEKNEVLAPNHRDMFDPSGRRERMLHWFTGTTRGRVMTWFFVMAVAVLFYEITYSGAHLFHDYAAGAAQPPGSYTAVRNGWWANWHHYPLLAVMWIIVGAAGLYWAMLDLMSFARRTLTLCRVASSDIWRFVSSRSHVQHPWDPLMRLTNLRIWGFVLFLLTIVDVIYLARSPHAGGAANFALGFVTILVVVVTLIPARRYFRAVQQAYDGALGRELAALRQFSAGVPAGDFAAQNFVVLRRLELSFENVQPSLSAVNRITRMALLAVTVVGFLASLVQLSVS